MTLRFCSFSTSVVLLVCCFIIATQSARAEDGCKPLYEANAKRSATPFHSFQDRTAQFLKGQTESSESISVNGAVYVKVRGVWRKSPVTVGEMQAQQEENIKNARNTSCKYLPDETVGGQPTRVFSAHSETEDDKADNTLWISKSTGLPVKQEEDIDVGGMYGKSHMSIRYDDGNVSAPSVK